MPEWKRAHYITPENELIAREEDRHMVYEQRRSVFLPREAVVRTRYTCRDQNGKPRLLYNVDIMDCIAELCRREERDMGVIVAESTERQDTGADGARKRWEDERRAKKQE